MLPPPTVVVGDGRELVIDNIDVENGVYRQTWSRGRRGAHFGGENAVQERRLERLQQLLQLRDQLCRAQRVALYGCVCFLGWVGFMGLSEFIVVFGE